MNALERHIRDDKFFRTNSNKNLFAPGSIVQALQANPRLRRHHRAKVRPATFTAILGGYGSTHVNPALDPIADAREEITPYLAHLQTMTPKVKYRVLVAGVCKFGGIKVLADATNLAALHGGIVETYNGRGT